MQAYSPELMVTPIYHHANICSNGPVVRELGTVEDEQDFMVDAVESILPKLHALAIGPGLGRDPNVLEAVARVIQSARRMNVPLVLDADACVCRCQWPRSRFLAEMHPNSFGTIAHCVLCCGLCCCSVFLVSQRPDLIRGRAGGAPVILTPNVRECGLLAKSIVGDENASIDAVAKSLNGPIILRKGPVDQVCGADGQVCS